MNEQLVKMNIVRRFLHNVLGWHSSNDTLGWNGTSFTSHCKYCGERILQDSQGNWFT
jgi:hypothetical protein